MERRFLLVDASVLPDVFIKVLKAKELLASGTVRNISSAARQAGLSRSAFYKYKDEIYPISDNTRGKTVTLVIQMRDEPGYLADLLRIVADYRANILTIHQAIPVNGFATVTLSVEVLPETGNVDGMVEEIEQLPEVHDVKILGMEK